MAEHKIMNDLRGYLTDQQLNKIEKACDNPRDRILLRLLMTNGRRITEVLGRKEYIDKNKRRQKTYPEVQGIRPMDINWEEGLIAFNILKKRKPLKKLKPVDDKTLALLKDYIFNAKIADDMPIFPITRQRAFQIVRRICDNCGIYYIGEKRPHPHHFRHSFAIKFLKTSDNPMGLAQLKRHLEHSSLDTTGHYLQFSQRDQRKTLNKMWKEDDDNGKDGESIRENAQKDEQNGKSS